jgi:hypothetical protein
MQLISLFSLSVILQEAVDISETIYYFSHFTRTLGCNTQTIMPLSQSKTIIDRCSNYAYIMFTQE